MTSPMWTALILAFGVRCGVGENADLSISILYLNEPALLEATKTSLEKYYGNLIAHETNGTGCAVTSSTGVVGRATVTEGPSQGNNSTTLVSAIIALDGSTVAQIKSMMSTNEFEAKLLGGTETKVPVDSAARDKFNHVEIEAITLVSRALPPPAPPAPAAPAPVVTPAPEAGWPWWGTVLIVVGVLAVLAVIAVVMICNSGEKKKSTRGVKKPKAVPAPPPPAPVVPEVQPEAQPLFGNMHEFAVTINEHPMHMGQPVTYQQAPQYMPMPVQTIQAAPMMYAAPQPAPVMYAAPQPMTYAAAPQTVSGSYMQAAPQYADAGFPMEPMAYQPAPMQSGSHMVPAGGSVSMGQPVQTNMSPVPVYMQVPQ